MSQKDRYIEKVLEEIFAPKEDSKRLSEDLSAHFVEGAAAGDTESAIIGRLGPPEEVAASFMDGSEPRFAGLWIRALAFSVDMAIILAAIVPVFCGAFLLLTYFLGGEATEQWLVPAVFVPAVLWALALFIFYFPVLEHVYGKTVAKHVLGLRVLTENKTRVGLGRAFLRRMSFYFEFLVLDALFVPFTAKKQRALDIVSKTVVVKERDPSAAGLLVCLLIAAWPLALGLIFVFLLAEPAG